MLNTLSRTLRPDDYSHLRDEVARVGHAVNMFKPVCDVGHEHRYWEYSLALASLGSREAIKGLKIVDVGCGASLLPGLLVWHGAHVTAIDCSNHAGSQTEMGRRGASSVWGSTPGGSLEFVQSDGVQELGEFDAVFSISVIEHGDRDDEFFAKLLRSVKPGGTLLMTTDFYPTGEQRNTGHSRTYNAERLEKFGSAAGFHSPGGFDYRYDGDFVFNYSFGSLHLKRAG